MNTLKFFQILTFLWYAGVIGFGISNDYDWELFFPHLFSDRYGNKMFLAFIFPAIVIWGSYFIIKK